MNINKRLFVYRIRTLNFLQNWYTIKNKTMIISREFRKHQKKYFELVDQNEQVVVQRAKIKAYVLVPLRETDRFFSEPSVIAHLNESLTQAQNQQFVTTLENKEDIRKYLDL